MLFGARRGDRKKTLLISKPEEAVNILRNESGAHVVVVPDLYPPNKAFPHRTLAELRDGVRANFRAEMKRLGVSDERVAARFKVFCFKYDFEVLLLAAEDRLLAHLGRSSSPVGWTEPVEDQNHDKPPKRVVEELFAACGERYRGTVDAPRILEGTGYRALAEQCSEGFGALVDFLEAVGPTTPTT